VSAVRGASETTTRKKTKINDAKRTGSRQHHEITLLWICLLCTTNWFTVSSTYDDVKNDGRLLPQRERGINSRIVKRLSLLDLDFTFSEHRKFLYQRMRKYL